MHLKIKQISLSKVIIFTFTVLFSGCRSDVPSLGSESLSNIVETSDTPIHSIYKDRICIFKDLRYAVPSVGKQKFKHQAFSILWTKPTDTSGYGCMAMQDSGPGGPASGLQKADSDCLFSTKSHMEV